MAQPEDPMAAWLFLAQFLTMFVTMFIGKILGRMVDQH